MQEAWVRTRGGERASERVCQSAAPAQAAGRARSCELVEAVAEVDCERVNALLGRADVGAALDAVDAEGRTPLMLAALHGELGLLRRLLDAGADPEAQLAGDPARGLGSARARAIAAGEGAEHRTALSFAVESGELEIVEILLARGANPYNAGATTPLDLAILGGDAEIVRVLLDAGADPNARDSEGDTPLMIAAAAGDAETITALIELGAIVSARNDDGGDALAVAARTRRSDAVAALAPYYPWWARLRARRTVRRRAARTRGLGAERIAHFHADALHGRIAAVRKALASGVDADAMGTAGGGPTALFQAVRGGHIAVIRALVAVGADPNHRWRAETPLIVALGPGALDPRGRGDVIRALVGAGANIEERDGDGLTPLMRAVLLGSGGEAAVVALCDMGVDLGAEHLSGLTAIDLAAQDPAKAHLARRLELYAKRSELSTGRARQPRPGARRPSPDLAVELLRGLGDPRTRESVVAVRAPINSVSPLLERQRGGRQWSRDVFVRDGLFVGEEGYLVYQLRGHDWTLAQSSLLDGRALRAEDARALSLELGCDALFYESCGSLGILAFDLYRAGGVVERFSIGPVEAEGATRGAEARKVDFESTLRSDCAPQAGSAVAFVDRSFSSWELFVPGLDDDRLGWIEREFRPEDFERVDFLRAQSTDQQ
jgi:ankyrin repeat protein